MFYATYTLLQLLQRERERERERERRPRECDLYRYLKKSITSHGIKYQLGEMYRNKLLHLKLL